jgi:hypothetical protein
MRRAHAAVIGTLPPCRRGLLVQLGQWRRAPLRLDRAPAGARVQWIAGEKMMLIPDNGPPVEVDIKQVS